MWNVFWVYYHRRKSLFYALHVMCDWGIRRNIMNEFIDVKEIFGENVFNDSAMKARLPKKVYQELKKPMEEGKELDLVTADVVAHEMKEWAIEKGATH